MTRRALLAAIFGGLAGFLARWLPPEPLTVDDAAYLAALRRTIEPVPGGLRLGPKART